MALDFLRGVEAALYKPLPQKRGEVAANIQLFCTAEGEGSSQFKT